MNNPIYMPYKLASADQVRELRSGEGRTYDAFMRKLSELAQENGIDPQPIVLIVKQK